MAKRKDTRLGHWIKEEMRKGGIPSQRELASRLGVSATAVNHWIRGIREPDDVSISILAQFFGVSRARIYELLGRMAPVEDEVYRDWVEILEQATPDERADILDYARYRLRRGRSASQPES